MKLNRFLKSTILIFSATIMLSTTSERKEDGLPNFLFPLNPGVQNYLAGTMGELRPNHYHAGIDIKTFGRINLPIYSIEDGFVSRIKVSRYGYGKVIYVEHPTGHTSVYAHLNKFNDELEKYITNTQYEKEVFEIELFPPAGMFNYKRGDVIAYSGNTGGSTGPHLHFEIRDIDQQPLNPLIFNFEEIKDNIAPTFRELAVKPLALNSRVDHEFTRHEVRIKRVGRSRYDAGYLEAYGLIGLEVDCFDRLDEMPNKNGVSTIIMTVNEDTVYHYHMDKFSFYDTRCLNQHIDYPIYKSKGVRFQKCYQDDGNNLENYTTNKTNGKINIDADSIYNVKICLIDAYQNDAELKFKIKGKKPKKEVDLINSSAYVTPRYTVHNNIVKVIFPQSDDSLATVYKMPVNEKVSWAYKKRNTTVFLLDLNESLPDSISYGGKSIHFNFDTSIVPENRVKYYYKDMTVDFYKTTLFDTLFVMPEVTKSHVIINNEKIPLKNGINITLQNLKGESLEEGVKAYQINYNGYPSYVGGEADKENNSFTFYTKELGKFTLLKDDKAPIISYIRHNSKTIVLKVYDDLSGIGEIRASINGKWVLMEYDKHIITAKIKEENLTFAGDFEITVSDNSGNVASFKKHL